MKYTIDWMEKKMTTKGEIIKASIVDENGGKTDEVAIFGTFPGYSNLRPGSELNAELIIKQNGQYTNKYLNPEKTERTNTLRPSIGMKAAQERKGEMIKEAQERKNESIAYFNAVNSAISLISTISILSNDERKEFIVYWRDWFLEEWKKYEAQDVKDKRSPF